MIMNKRKLKFGILFVALFFCVAFSMPVHADYKIGVLTKRGAPTCMKKWGATGAYLSEKIGEKFKKCWLMSYAVS